MSDELGPLSYAKGEEHIFLGREIAQHRDYSEDTARTIDQEISKLIRTSYATAKEILTDNLDIVHKLSAMLIEQETVMGKELDEMITSMRPGIKLPYDKSAKKAGTAEETARDADPAV